MRLHGLLHAAGDALGIQLFGQLRPLADRQHQPGLGGQLLLQGHQVPLIVDRVGRYVLGHQILDHVGADAFDVVVHRFSVQQFVALGIDDLALVVVDVVEIQQVLADVEVVRFHLALRLLDLAADQPILDDVVFLHADQLHRLLHPVGSEDAHQVVFKRQVETRGAWITLATRTAAQLVVDAARLMALGANDMQAAGGDHVVVALLPLALDAHAIQVRSIFRQLFELGIQ